jgi:hypothetical protein
MHHSTIQKNHQCLAALENAHTAIHQALEQLKKENLTLSKQKQAEAIRFITNSLANL